MRQVEEPKDLKEKVKDVKDEKDVKVVKALWMLVDICGSGPGALTVLLGTAAEATEPSPKAVVEAAEAAESDAEAEPQRRRPGRVSTWVVGHEFRRFM